MIIFTLLFGQQGNLATVNSMSTMDYISKIGQVSISARFVLLGILRHGLL